MKDTIFRSDKIKGKFRFDEKVASVFDDMLSRSVPFYTEVQKMLAELAADHYQAGTGVYDLGCSTGTTIVNLCKSIGDPDLKITGIDSSGPVIEKAMAKVNGYGLGQKAQLICADVMDVEIKGASVIIMNYTLQFIPSGLRGPLLHKIYEGLEAGGALLLSEKVLEEASEMNTLFTEKHHEFKRMMGYSDLEISRKRETLEEVLIPFTAGQHFKLLRSAGFKRVSIFFKWFNFASFIAVKG